MQDIVKALEVKHHSNPKEKLSKQYHAWLEIFEWKKADTLPPHHGPQVDHKIKL